MDRKTGRVKVREGGGVRHTDRDRSTPNHRQTDMEESNMNGVTTQCTRLKTIS